MHNVPFLVGVLINIIYFFENLLQNTKHVGAIQVLISI